MKIILFVILLFLAGCATVKNSDQADFPSTIKELKIPEPQPEIRYDIKEPPPPDKPLILCPKSMTKDECHKIILQDLTERGV